ncbi:hypothetical protein CPB85DRAFT_1326180 [Mucidula mucida]|nr:hypothetical protein CPB85DRAFT_1326180 [Mucidula mucida]
MLSLTWDFRTFHDAAQIREFLSACLHLADLNRLRLREETISLQQPFPDAAWIQTFFDFETKAGSCSGLVHLVPTPEGSWKAHSVFTNLESLRDLNVGNHSTNLGESIDLPPTVLIVGGAQSGLGLASHLQQLHVPTLVVEKTQRLGDKWRQRYESLCLHFPVDHDHLPRIPFPDTGPRYMSAAEFADWLEQYAASLNLNVWTSSTVSNATQRSDNSWDVTVEREDGFTRQLNVEHIVFATGIGDDQGSTPTYAGMDNFRGTILHSNAFRRTIAASPGQRRRVFIIGSGTSAHDIAADLYTNGADVTMFQRGPTYVMSQAAALKYILEGLYSKNGPPTDVADRLVASFPTVVATEIAQHQTLAIEEHDAELLTGLRSRGFRLSRGIKDTGYFLLGLEKLGGYYIDVGASQLIVDGHIKLKNNCEIDHFTQDGVKFCDGEELPADLVICATGCGDPKEIIRHVCGGDVADQCKPICGLNEEGEVRGCWGDLGISGLWYMTGTLALCRFHSKHVALQIKAMSLGVFGPRYSA